VPWSESVCNEERRAKRVERKVGGDTPICALLISIFIVIADGCAKPKTSVYQQERKKPDSQRASLGSVPTTPVDDDPHSTVPVERLTVHGESVEAKDVWKGHYLELQARRESMSPHAFRAYVEERAAQLIQDKIVELLLYHQASLRTTAEALQPLDRIVDEQIRKTITTEHGGVQRRYERYLESQGQSLGEVRERLRRELLVARYLELEIRPKVAEPTRGELLSYYESNKSQWSRPARRSMSLIDVRVVDRLAEEVDQPTREQLADARAEARRRIEAAREALRSGLGFADAAKQYSDGLNAAEGGAWGWITREGVRKRFEPAVDALLQNFPNPFREGTAIHFALARSGPVRLEVFDAAGRLVSTLVSGELEAGAHQVQWKGRDQRNQAAPTGVYYYRLTTPGFRQTRKMIHLP